MIINNQIKEHSIGNTKDNNGENDWLYPNLKNKHFKKMKSLIVF